MMRACLLDHFSALDDPANRGRFAPVSSPQVERRLEQAAEEGEAGVLDGLRFPLTRVSSFRRRPESSG